MTSLVGSSGGTWQPVERYVYDAYGAVSYANSNWSTFSTYCSAANNTVLYTGREFDPETGVYYYRDAVLQRT